jgi:hypothetical protein
VFNIFTPSFVSGFAHRGKVMNELFSGNSGEHSFYLGWVHGPAGVPFLAVFHGMVTVHSLLRDKGRA